MLLSTLRWNKNHFISIQIKNQIIFNKITFFTPQDYSTKVTQTIFFSHCRSLLRVTLIGYITFYPIHISHPPTHSTNSSFAFYIALIQKKFIESRAILQYKFYRKNTRTPLKKIFNMREKSFVYTKHVNSIRRSP